MYVESIEGIGTGNAGVMSDFVEKVVVWAITLTYFPRTRRKKWRKNESKIEHKIEKKKKKHLNG
jgi:hypothetical protein